MKMKLLLGFSVVAMGAAFWACGTGSIEDLSAGDENARDLYGLDPDALDQLVAEAKKNCADDESCVAAQEKAEPIKIESSESEEEPESSAEGDSAGSDQKSSASTPKSSATPASSGATPASSASVAGSSTSTATSSAAIIVPTSSAAALGQPTCKASASEVDKGKSLTWTVGLIGATMTSWSWTFEGGGPSVGTASGSKTATVTYNGPSGATKTTVVVGTSNGNKTAECYAQVNGAPITGCSCSVDASSSDLDVADGSASITWAVSGCAASGSTIESYTWDGGATGTSYTKKVTEKGEYSASVTVKSAEGSQKVVDCGSAKVKNSSDLKVTIEISGSSYPSAITVPNGGCIDVVGIWSNSGYSPTPHIQCTGDDKGIVITYGGTEIGNSVGKNQGHCDSKSLGTISYTEETKTFFENICIELTAQSSVTCKLVN